MCKSTGPDSAYQAGARGWQWIKLKRTNGPNCRTPPTWPSSARSPAAAAAPASTARSWAVYDADADVFRAGTKCGAGFSDADLAGLPARLATLLSPRKPARVDARQEPDVWFEPGLVLEILSAELTLSPNYTAAWGQLAGDAGLAMRFPRFTGRWRDDKAPEDAITKPHWSDPTDTARATPPSGSSGDAATKHDPAGSTGTEALCTATPWLADDWTRRY